ncbi:MAG TPA: transposase [Gammaproteobacteria bacterium]|nr:transposase [Gammaproteobacteria bacterium]
MIGQDTLLVMLVRLVERLPLPPAPIKRARGRPKTYGDRLFLKALVIMIVRHLHTVYELLSVLSQPTSEMQTLRSLLTEQDQYPSRRTWERRLKALPDNWPAQIGCLGRYLVSLIQPWASCGRAAAIDSTVLRSRGGVWHKKDRDSGEVPHTSIDTEAHWTKSGWHGWVYGWKLHLIATVAGVWIPLAADLTAANVADSEMAAELVCRMAAEVRYLLGDRHYNTPELREQCADDGRILITSRYGRYPHSDGGVEVRRMFHKLRSTAIENLNEQFKAIFDGHGQVPTKGLTNTRRFALGAILVYQLSLWYRFEHGLDLRVGLKPFLKAA